MASLRRRFSLAFLLLVFLPGLLVNVALSRLYLSALFSTVSRQTETVIAQVAGSITGEVDGISMLVSALFHDAELRAFAELYSQAGSAGERRCRTGEAGPTGLLPTPSWNTRTS